MLAEHTSLRVGGPASYYSRPENPQQLEKLVQLAHGGGIAVAILAGGTNTIFPDSGYHGLVIHTTRLRGVATDGERLTAAAGEPLSSIAWRACRAGLSGLEWACGIPGTIGGAIVMNAGTCEGDMAGVVKRVDLQDPGDRTSLGAPDLALGYRTSAILTGAVSGVIVEAELKLHTADPEICVSRARELLAARLERLPVGPSAGCIFRNPEHGATAGELLDRAGCKGMRVGAAHVSDRHANIIINDGSGNAADVLRLIEQMKTRARKAFEVELQEEVVVY